MADKVHTTPKTTNVRRTSDDTVAVDVTTNNEPNPYFTLNLTNEEAAALRDQLTQALKHHNI